MSGFVKAHATHYITGLLIDYGYQLTWSDGLTINFRLPDTNVRASLDPKKGSVSFFHSTRAEERYLFGSDSPAEVSAWLHSANAKGLYRCVDTPEERQHI